MQSINGYLGDVDNAWNDYNGESLAKLLSFRDVHVFNPRLHLENPESAVEKVLGSQIDEVRYSYSLFVKNWHAFFFQLHKCQIYIMF